MDEYMNDEILEEYFNIGKSVGGKKVKKKRRRIKRKRKYNNKNKKRKAMKKKRKNKKKRNKKKKGGQGNAPDIKRDVLGYWQTIYKPTITGKYNNKDKDYLNKEIDSLIKEIDPTIEFYEHGKTINFSDLKIPLDQKKILEGKANDGKIYKMNCENSSYNILITKNYSIYYGTEYKIFIKYSGNFMLKTGDKVSISIDGESDIFFTFNKKLDKQKLKQLKQLDNINSEIFKKILELRGHCELSNQFLSTDWQVIQLKTIVNILSHMIKSS